MSKQHLSTSAKSDDRIEGTIRKMLPDKGFGFIADSQGTEYFFHRSSIRGHHWEDVTIAQKVSFVVRDTPKGPRAEEVEFDYDQV